MQTTPTAPKQEGCVAAAWNDIRSTPGWLKKTLALCLLGVVPVLNFAVEGYALRWSRELSFGKRTNMPREIFKKREIATGFFAWIVRAALAGVFTVVTTLAIWFLAGLVGIVSAPGAAGVFMLLSFLCWIFEFFFYGPLMNVSVQRMAIVDYLESGFNIRKTWKSFLKNMGSAISASVLPPIVIGIVEIVIILIGIFIISAAIAAAAYGVMGSGSPQSLMYSLSNPQAAIGAVIGAGYGVMFLVALFVILAIMLNTFSMMLVTRAMGHWAARTAPEWASESDAPADSAPTSAASPRTAPTRTDAAQAAAAKTPRATIGNTESAMASTRQAAPQREQVEEATPFAFGGSSETSTMTDENR